MKLVQWVEHDDGLGYSVSGPTIDQLPPGMYDLAISNQTGLVWVPVDTRTDDLIRFPDTPSATVVSEVERFWGLEELFTSHGLPFKRGILLWGPPGSGKTCTLRQVAEDVVNRDGYVLIFRKIEPFLVAYRQLRAVHPNAPLVVIMEDLDALLGEPRGDVSAILNLLDGVEEVNRVVFLATTNFPQQLGARVANRPSRFDRRIKIAHPDEQSRQLYLESMTIDSDDVDISRLAHDSEGMSLAHVKELFVATVILGADYGETLGELKGMRDLPNSAVNDEEEFNALFGYHGGGYA